jgi:LAO/AO transport system kinase
MTGSLHERVAAGEVRACARLLRWIDDEAPGALDELKALYPMTHGAYVLGITGNPGSGKSTLTNALIRELLKTHGKVGVLAVDPSSPFTGGAILGDRIRMQEHAGNPNVFIRSLATRGNLGGLSRATYDSIFVLDAWGADVIVIETVGVGQDEIEIVNCADTSLVVLVPGLGDEVQAIKAGILEIADVFVVNKADREGADKVVQNLRAVQELVRGSVSRVPEIVKTAATRAEGLPELMVAIAAHRGWLAESGEGLRRRKRFLEQTVLRHVHQRLLAEVEARLAGDGHFASAVDDLLARRVDPFTLSDDVLAHVKGT